MASSSLPSTIAGISIAKNGGLEVLDYKADLSTPKPGKGQVLVKNDFIGVNFIDTYFRSGLYKVPSFPYTLGREGAGTIVALGDGETYSLKVGDRVAYLVDDGSYAEYTCTPAVKTFALPDHVTTEVGAATMMQGLTALTMIREGYHVQKGDWILIHAAAGGMGQWLCELLRVVGARIIGTASTAEKRALATRAGAEVVLEYASSMEGGDTAFVAKIMELTGGEGVAAALDGVGKETFDVSLACVRRKGTMISFGNASGAVEPFLISRLASGNIRLMRPMLNHFIATREEFANYSTDLFELMQKGGIAPQIHKVYPLKDAREAQGDLQGRKTTGKLLLKP